MGKIRILILDDDESFPELFSNNLNQITDWYFEIRYYKDWNNEISQKITYDYDLYVVDHRFNGIGKSQEIIGTIRHIHPDACIFLISKHGSFRLAKELIERGVDGIIDKDIMSFEFLIEKVQEKMEDKSRLKTLKTTSKKLQSKLVVIQEELTELKQKNI